jgi:hypothetical protein
MLIDTHQHQLYLTDDLIFLYSPKMPAVLAGIGIIMDVQDIETWFLDNAATLLPSFEAAQ